MATELEVKRWQEYNKNYREKFLAGIKSGQIRTYEQGFLDKLDRYYFGGLPLSIVLLCNKACNGFCYDRAVFVALGLEDEDYVAVNADINSLRLNPIYIDEKDENPNYANHCFVIKKDKDGKEYVYDSSVGLVFDKSWYDEVEKPVVTRVMPKEEVMTFDDYRYFKSTDLELVKYALPLIMPTYDALAMIGQPYYTEELRRRLALFKEYVGYEKLKREMEEDMEAKGFMPKKKKS